MGVLKKIIEILTNRWVLSVLGILFLSLFIWYVGQILAFGSWVPLGNDGVRLGFIVIVILIWLGINLYRAYQQKKTNQNIIDTLAGGRRTAKLRRSCHRTRRSLCSRTGSNKRYRPSKSHG